jgi:hypothetical protein
MGISKFLILLIIGTIVFLFIEKDRVITNLKNEEKPKVSFFDSTMYEITNNGINQVVTSKIANMYNKKEELYEATIVTKANENSYATNIISGGKIVKKGDEISLNGSVNLVLSDKTNIKTEQLDYNTQTKIATNTVDFVAIRENDRFSGNTLFLDTINEQIEAKKANFRMKVIK